MKSVLRFAAMSVMCATMVACTQAQTDKFIDSVQNFARGVAAVDDAIKDVNATLYSNCVTIQTVAESINNIAGQCSAAAPYTSTANSVINKYCQASELSTNGGIAASIKVTAASVSAAKSTLAANKQACAKGG